MPIPQPNGPSLNDLLYGGYNQSGYQNVSTLVGADFVSQSQIIFANENVALNFVGYTGTANTSDFLAANENVALSLDQPGPQQFAVGVADTSATSESVDPLKAGARNVNTSTSIVTSENVAVVEA